MIFITRNRESNVENGVTGIYMLFLL